MRALLLSAVIFAVCVQTARSEIRVIDVRSGASTTVVSDDRTDLVRWTDDGAGLLVRADGGGFSRVSLDGTRSTLAPIDGAIVLSIGPGGRSITIAKEEPNGEYTVRAGDGHVVSAQHASGLNAALEVAWSAEGTLVAIAERDRTLVLDTATGAVLVGQQRELSLTEQAFTTDNSAIVGTDDDQVLRIAIPSGQTTVLGRAQFNQAPPASAVSSAGRVAVTSLGTVKILQGPTIKLTGDPGRPTLWSPDGQQVSVGYLSAAADGCSPYALQGLAVGTPGQPLRVLIKPTERELGTAHWSPDGTRLAIKLGYQWPPAKRGHGHPWPRHTRSGYGLPTAAANAAARRIIQRAAHALRGNATRETVINRVRRDYTELQKRYPQARRATVRSAVATELDRWLTAAGYKPTESFIEISC